MGVEENKQAMRRFYDEVINAGNTDVIDELAIDDFVEHEQLPGLENVSGKDAVKQWVGIVRNAFPDVNVTVEDVIAEGETVVARGRLSGTHKGDFMGIAPTNESFDIELIDVVRMKNGKAAEHWGLTDTLGMLAQLGVENVPQAPGVEATR